MSISRLSHHPENSPPRSQLLRDDNRDRLQKIEQKLQNISVQRQTQ